ncbi:MAG TPA: hypothetical protein DIS76_03290 [Rhodospirillaceae bacterium]|nr:hypothetical protein [Rhodospirillaceae bacterium]
MQPLMIYLGRAITKSARVALPVFALAVLSASPAFAQTDPLSLDLMLAKFIEAINGPMMQLTYTGGYIFGAYLIMKGLLKCVKYSDEGSKGQQKFSGIWGSFMFGAMLIALPSVMATMGNTLGFDSTTEPMLSYDNQHMSMIDVEVQEKLDRTYKVIIMFVQMLGMISFTRGLSILRSVSDGNTQVTSMAGITHIVAGAIGWNLGDFVAILGNTVGFTLVS